jgi:hypothetical protein
MGGETLMLEDDVAARGPTTSISDQSLFCHQLAGAVSRGCPSSSRQFGQARWRWSEAPSMRRPSIWEA